MTRRRSGGARGCVLAACLLAAAVASCGGDRTTSPAAPFEASRSVSGVIRLAGQSVLRCTSTQGPVSVEGPGVPGQVGWSLLEMTTAPTEALAEAALGRIEARDSTRGDTLVFDVVTPPTTLESYAAATTLSMPSGMDCVVDGATAPVHVAYLVGALRVRGTDAVTVQAHHGSFDVATHRGPVQVEAAVPAVGLCGVAADTGDVALSLPASSDVTLIARTRHGTVSVGGLVLAARIDSTGFVSGTLGAGTDTVRLVTGAGNVTVSGLP